MQLQLEKCPWKPYIFSESSVSESPVWLSAMTLAGAIAREFGDRTAIARVLHNLGIVANHRRDYAQAHAYLTECLAAFADLGDKGSIALTLYTLGLVADGEGNAELATERFRESLRLRHALGEKLGATDCLLALADHAGRRGNRMVAGRLFGAAEALRRAIGAPWLPEERERYDRAVTAYRDTDGAAAWDAGRKLSLDNAAAEALDGTAP
mgnify:CR=1 FL=1